MANGADLANFTLELVKNVGLVSCERADFSKTPPKRCSANQIARTHAIALAEHFDWSKIG